MNGIEGNEDCFDNATPTFDTISSDIAESPKEGNNNLSYVVNIEVFYFHKLFHYSAQQVNMPTVF